MALLEEQFTETLQAGAPDITYQGNEGQEQKIARELWDQLPPEAQQQFGNFQQFFSSGAWKQVLQMLQKQMQQQAPQQMAQGPQQMAPQPQQGLGSMMPAQMAYGGIAGADGRRAYGIGSWFQEKIMDPIKKNPLISAAVLAGGSHLIPGLPTTGWMDPLFKNISKSSITKGLGNILSKPEWMIPAASLVAGAFAKPEQQLEGGAISRGAGINLQDVAKLANITDEKQGQAIGLNFLPEASARKYSPEEMALTYASKENAAQGGRIGYQEGTLVADLDAVKDSYSELIFGKPVHELTPDELIELEIILKDKLGGPFSKKEMAPEGVMTAAQGGRIGYDNGGVMKASYGYHDAMGESWEEYKRLQKKGVIPIDMEFEEFLELQQEGGFMEMAQGGRIGLKKGSKKKGSWMDFIYDDEGFNLPGFMIPASIAAGSILPFLKEGGRIKKQEGGLMSLGGMEMDLRGGGFVPLGAKEKADDVPARLSKNEFVFTADAVRAAGGGDVDAGADKMYNTMKQLESRVG